MNNENIISTCVEVEKKSVAKNIVIKNTLKNSVKLEKTNTSCKRELQMEHRRLAIYRDALENLQESRGYARWFLGWNDGLYFPPLSGTIKDAMEHYNIDNDDVDWIDGFKTGQDRMDWSIPNDDKEQDEKSFIKQNKILKQENQKLKEGVQKIQNELDDVKEDIEEFEYQILNQDEEVNRLTLLLNENQVLLDYNNSTNSDLCNTIDTLEKKLKRVSYNLESIRYSQTPIKDLKIENRYLKRFLNKHNIK